MRRRARHIVVFGVLCAAIAFLAYTTVANAAEYYYNVDQVTKLSGAAAGRFLQVHGRVLPGSIDWRPAVPELRFQLEWNGAVLPVVYRGVKPDVFQDGLEAVAAGRLQGGTLQATDVTVKCPSKYEPAVSR
ncbi:MAG: cytochrome c maturation protein CcmE [Firmicutes bacterium]|nr:cytochrome c maturation protein CcmE [Bacillota bacterium]